MASLRCDFCTMFVSPKTAVKENYNDGEDFLLCPSCAKGHDRRPPTCSGCGRFVAWSCLRVFKSSGYFDPDEYDAEVDCPNCGLMPTGVK